MSSDEHTSPERRDPDAAAEQPESSEKPQIPKTAPEGTVAQGDAPAEDKPKSTTATFYDDPYDEDAAYEAANSKAVEKTKPEPEKTPPPPPPPSNSSFDDDDDDDDGMARMSFLEHLEELRTRLISAIKGLAFAYAACLVFAQQIFGLAKMPFDRAAAELASFYPLPLTLIAVKPTEQFHQMYIKLPLLGSIFLASPWLMYQAWAFIAPGLYQRERRWARPFIWSTAVLFIMGGLFGYFVVLKFALAFLLGIGRDVGVTPTITVEHYFDTFIAVELALGVVFQMPVVIFFLTLIRILNPGFLLENVRYAILGIFILAAVVTPTPDVLNMLLFAAPMILLFYVGIGASFILVYRREGRSLPWMRIGLLLLALAAVVAGVIYLMHSQLGYQFVPRFPWFVPPA